MHNCRETKEQITELLLDGTDRPDEVLSAELRCCAECRSEFDSLNATLRVTSRLKESSGPSEGYWIRYHAKLREKLVHANMTTAEINGPFWGSFFRSSVSVPVPVVAALIIACAVLIPVGIRAARKQRLQPPAIVSIPVEVPVVQEKVVTRVVYRDRRILVRSSTRVIDSAKTDGTLAKSQKPPQNAELPASLIGFKPTEEIKLTVIKGGSQNEK